MSLSTLFGSETPQIVITGASAGIGAEFARQLHAMGASLLLLARREDRLNALCAELNSKRANSARFIVTDLSDSKQLEQTAQSLSTERVDLLINNAGRGSFNYFEKLSVEEELQMVRLNIDAALRLSHAVIPQMKSRKNGAIIYLSSIAGFTPLPYMSTYAATKAFDLFHSLGLRAELAQFGVRVLCVCPGPTATEFGGVARVPGEMTSISRDSAELVVSQSLEALGKNRALIVPGVRSGLLALGARILPLSLTAWLVERALRGSLRAAL